TKIIRRTIIRRRAAAAAAAPAAAAAVATKPNPNPVELLLDRPFRLRPLLPSRLLSLPLPPHPLHHPHLPRPRKARTPHLRLPTGIVSLPTTTTTAPPPPPILQNAATTKSATSV